MVVVIVAVLAAPFSSAHNEIVHRDLVDFAYQQMLAVESAVRQGRQGRVFQPPEGVDAGEWSVFLQKIAAAPGKYRVRSSDLGKVSPPLVNICESKIEHAQPLPDRWWDRHLGEIGYPVSIDFSGSAGCGVDPDATPGGIFEPGPGTDRRELDHTGIVLGFWSASVDRQFDDTHLWIRPTSVLGMGAATSFIDKVVDKGLGAILLPIVCAFDCLFNDCDDCDKDAADIADAANPLDDVAGWIPGIGDISGADWVGLWHHINVKPDASNEFDDPQGEFFEEAGPADPPDPLDVVLMAVFDTGGLSVHYDDSQGVHRYQIGGANDGHRDTTFRNLSQWQFTTIAHVPFEPVSNLAYFGWRSFRDDPEHPISWLGWPLHAIGDATVPMHVVATSAWGHRPFEDAQQRLWPEIRRSKGTPEEQTEMMRAVLLRAFGWWQFIQQWRTAHPEQAGDTPVRELVVQLAKHTYDYSMTEFHRTGGAWPFNRATSTLYLVAEEEAVAFYTEFLSAADLGRPLFEDGLGATIALLTSASEILPTVP